MMRQKRTGAVPPQMFRDLSGNTIQLARRLGAGGEAEVFAVEGNDALVAKIYKLPSSDRERKLHAMIQNPPVDPTLAAGHRSICWPETLLYDSRNHFAGFLMSRIDFTTNRLLLAFYNPISRQKISIELTWQHLVRVAINVCSVVEAIHSQGHLIGDVNESNFLVSNSARVTLVDCDSIQVLDKQRGIRYRCPVGKAEFTPPELQDRDFSGIDRDTTHDYFSLGVISFLLLMEGVHPFMGRWRGYGNTPQLHENIKDGRFPYSSHSGVLAPSPIAPPFEMLPPEIRGLFDRCFSAGHDSPKARPSALEWQRALKRLDSALQVCGNNGHHVFSGHMTQCPWCQRAAKLGGFDPFPLHEPQIPKPPVAVHRPRAASVAPPAPIPVRKTGASTRTVTLYVLFAGACAAVIGAWLYFNSPLGAAAVDLWARFRNGAAPSAAEPMDPATSEAPTSPDEEFSQPDDTSTKRRSTTTRSRQTAPRQSDPGVMVLGPREGSDPNVLGRRGIERTTPPAKESLPVTNSSTAKAPANESAGPAAAPSHQFRMEKNYPAKHKHRLGGCDGILILTTDGIRFESEDHSFTFAAADTELHDDGITDPTRKNWHFSIKGTDVRALLSDWKEGSLSF